MSDVDITRLRTIARSLGVSPRALALALMRLARNADASAAERRQFLCDETRGAAAINLLLTSVADFGHDAVDRAFGRIWPPLAVD